MPRVGRIPPDRAGRRTKRPGGRPDRPAPRHRPEPAGRPAPAVRSASAVRSAPRVRSAQPDRPKESPDLLAGRNPVFEALRAGHPITRLLVAKGARSGALVALLAAAREKGIPVQQVDRERLEWLAGPGHQGVVAYAAAKEYAELDDLLVRARERGEDPLVVLVDSLEDPHNLGSILRTADAVGAHGVVIPKHRNVGLTTTVAKTSAGAIEHVPVARVSNLVQALAELKAAGLWVVGADQSAELEFTKARLRGPLAMVIGGEGAGLSRLVRERCDFLVRLPMRGRVNSLNAGVAAAVLLYEIVRQRAGPA